MWWVPLKSLTWMSPLDSVNFLGNLLKRSDMFGAYPLTCCWSQIDLRTLTQKIKQWIMIFRCKNFFKRSVVMTQKKPYICNNQNNCDVRIVIDMSGIKRKGARCQACRYIACLDAGMYHSGITEQPYQQIVLGSFALCGVATSYAPQS